MKPLAYTLTVLALIAGITLAAAPLNSNALSHGTSSSRGNEGSREITDNSASLIDSIGSLLDEIKQHISTAYPSVSTYIQDRNQLASLSGAGSGLVAHYTFDDGSGSTATDSSGNGNDGTLQGDPQWVGGKIGSGALEFDGNDDGVDLGDPSTLDMSATNSFTVSAWVYSHGDSGRVVFGRGEVNSSAGNTIYWLGSYFTASRWEAEVSDGTNKLSIITSEDTLDFDTWQHIALVFNGAADTLTLYTNGIELASDTNTLFTTVQDPDTRNDTGIGYEARSDTASWDGSIDDLRVYSRALTSAEITELYNLGANGGAGGTSDTEAPSTPDNLSASPASAPQINLSWNASTDNVGVEGYRVERCQGSSCSSFSQIAAPIDTSYSDTGLSADTTYRYRIRAADAAGNLSAYSSTASATTQSQSTTQHTLTISKSGTGSGTVTGTGISCGADCTHTADEGTSITLSASPSSGSTFAGWSGGGCSGTNSCTVTLNADTTVAATFNSQTSSEDTDSNDNFYIRDGAGGTTCSDWNNACDSLPPSLQRGATYYIADGTYLGYTFDDPEDGTKIITVKKATAADHGTNAGWQNSYGDGQVAFNGTLSIINDYYSIDGQWRNEQNWNDASGYGFKVDIPRGTAEGGAYGIKIEDANHIQIKYVSTDGSNMEDFAKGLKLGAGGADVSDISIYRSRFANNHDDAIKMPRASQVVLEESYIGPRLSSPSGKHGDAIEIHKTNNVTYRNNLHDYQGDGIHFLGTNGAYSTEWYIYGNVFRDISGFGSAIKQNSNSGLLGNIYVYNNTFYNLYSAVRLVAGGNFKFQNNLYYKVTTGKPGGATNIEVASDPFTDAGADNFRLQSTAVNLIDRGVPLGSPFNVDGDGNIRGADGHWDIGAYEYVKDGIQPVNASCGSTQNSCTAGTLNDTADSDTHYLWECAGSNGGSTASCSLEKPSDPEPDPDPIPGDLNDDGVVNSLDWSIMRPVWGTADSTADLNNDGVVNSIDFSVLNQNWTT